MIMEEVQQKKEASITKYKKLPPFHLDSRIPFLLRDNSNFRNFFLIKCYVTHLFFSHFNLNLQNCRTFKAVKITFKKCLQLRFTQPALIELSN
ncbi:hypothetical protein CEXT_372331 [Caerostris extrusa]|uniref:Uncharacterized protein n=1 Tax=Caerostris extrusa TaxID=172846 RepID=A0AAV4XFY3_CAEEX|nr:hypothetical protein CEXT_372331 [Caerostris extrusa]